MMKLQDSSSFLEAFSHSIYRFSLKNVGALVILENQDSLDEYANKSVLLNARFSSELLETIFSKTSSLRDGAVIIRETTIVSATTILPISEEPPQSSKLMGMRHRAGLGISMVSDAAAIVVSEETGRVSIARDGIIVPGVPIQRFKQILRSILNPSASPIRE